MLQKLKDLFKGKKLKAEERKEKLNTSAQQYARAERTEQKPAVKAAKPAQKQMGKPAPRKAPAPVKKPANKPAKRK